MSDIINARSRTIAPGPLTPMADLLTDTQIGVLARRLRGEIDATAVERNRRAKAGLPCASHARAIAATRATLAELGER
jgi:hypothetical protein